MSEKQDCRIGTISHQTYDDHTLILHVNTRVSCLLRVTDRLFPGWQAYLDTDEIPIYRAEGLFRAVFVRPGSHKVMFTFKPFSFKIGLFGSLVSITLTLSVLVGRFIR